MPTNITQKPAIKPLQGQEVIEEAARLLRRIHFSANRGAFAEGTHVTVSVDPRWNGDQATICVLLTCFAFGHRLVDWQGLPIFLVREDKGNGGWITWLNARGQAVAPSLPQGAYRLSLGIGARRLGPVLTPQAVEEDLPFVAQVKPDQRQTWYVEAQAEGIRGTVEETEDGEVQVAFETQEAKWAGHRIRFSLVEPQSGRVRYSQQLLLKTARTPGHWEDWCAVGPRRDFSGPFELVFEILSPDEGS